MTTPALSLGEHDLNQMILDEIKASILTRSASAKRSHQKAIGPSETSHPCDRRIGYKLLDIEKSNFPDPWFAIIGTAVHRWLYECYDAINKTLDEPRYLLEKKVAIAPGLSGSFDLYDKESKTLRDWKIVGDTSLKAVKREANIAYSNQLSQYALGLVKKGYDVQWLEIVYLPRTSLLRNAHIQRERFDIERARSVISRYSQIKADVKKCGISALSNLAAVSSSCDFCPYFLPGSPVLSIGCPGASA